MHALTFAIGGVLVFIGLTSGCSSDSDSDGGTSSGGSSASSNGGSSASSAGGAITGGASGSAASSSSGGAGSGGVSGSGGLGASGGTSGSGSGASGSGGFGTGGSGTGGGAGSGVGGCLPVDVQCSAPGATCCAGSECVQATPAPICLIPCEVGGDCTSGCCLKFGSVSRKVCGTAAECASCVAVGQTCSTQSPCCSSICVTLSDVSTCRPQCTVDGDCPNNCCRPLTNGPSVCLDPCPQ